MFIKRKKIRNNKGVVLAEFALTLPVLLGLLFFTIEFGNVFFISNTINNIANNAARYAAIYPSANEATLIDRAGGNVALSFPANLSLTVSPAPGTARNLGDPITVIASYNYTPTVNPFQFFNAPDAWAPSIMSTSVARVELTSE